MSRAGRVSLEPAWVLHHRPYRDSSEILDLLTLNHGRVAAVARGSRSGRRRTPLQPFQPLSVSWAGRGEMFTLTGAETAGPVLRPAGDALLSMFYVNELLLRLTGKQDPHPGLFEAYVATITDLGGGSDQAVCLRRFEKQLLDELGYGLSLSIDIDGRPVAAGERYFYELEHGPRRVGGDGGGPLIVSGDTLLAIENGRLDSAEQRTEARRLLTAAIDRYLGGRPLRTRQVLNAMRARPG